MRIAIAQLNGVIGDFEKNEQKIIRHIKKAEAEGADIVVFPELAVCGYPPEDLLNFDYFIAEAETRIENIAKACTKIAAIVGGPSKNSNGSLFNTAYFLAEGEIQSKHHKTLLPNNDVFNESRYFQASNQLQCAKYKGHTIAITVCEDLWEQTSKPKGLNPPLEKLSQEQPDFIVNISASPFSHQQTERRRKVFAEQAAKHKTPICMVNQVGAHADLIFDGQSAIFNAEGQIIRQLASLQEDFVVFDTEEQKKNNKIVVPGKYEQIENALILGIKDYFKKLNFTQATLGLSGGIDSALSLVLAVKALGNKNIIPLLLPSQFSSEHSITDSIELCKLLGCEYELIEIESIYKTFDQQLQPLFKGKAFDETEENIQSRIRGTLLMAQSNKFGSILLNTSNKSEMAVGYGTLYGDMAGGLSVIGDLYKTEVYELSKFINRKKTIIPKNIIEKPPSAELRPDQKDSDALPDYNILDKILYQYIELEKGEREIIASNLPADLVKKVLKLVNISEYKRTQTMPILRVSDKCFGRGRRFPLVAKL